jgi:hypothetical protein
VLKTLLEGIEHYPLMRFISESSWAFPTIETTHVLAIVLVAGTVAIVDLRLLGAASRDKSVVAVASAALPWTWGAFMVAVVTGALMFMSKGSHYIENWPFRLKLMLMAAAGLNMLFFHFRTFASVRQWDIDVPTPHAAKISAALSLVLWGGVIFFGRWIGFTVM